MPELRGCCVSNFIGGELYQEIIDMQGSSIRLTYNDLWLMIVCRESIDGDWIRMREATSMVYDSARKRTLVDRLWKLEQALDGLPEIPDDVTTTHLRHAHIWFNQYPVSNAKRTAPAASNE